MKYSSKFIISMLSTLFFACSSAKYISGKGLLLGKEISIDLDSGEAKEFLEDSEKMNALLKQYENVPLDNHLMAKIVKNHSFDSANIFLLSRLYGIKQNSISINSYYQYIMKLQQNSANENKLLLSKLHDYEILFVPGLAYKIDITTGADFSKQRNLLNKYGIKNSLIETGELGLADENANIIADKIKNSPSKKIILVSASKGGLEASIALGKLLDIHSSKKIHSWINVGGILQGTYVAEDHCNFPKSIIPIVLLKLKGVSSELIGDIQYIKRSSSFKFLTFNKEIKIIHYIGVPFRSQVKENIESNFKTLAALGPNDGLTTVTDSIAPPGIVIPEIGLDHYFKDIDIDKKTIALALLAVAADVPP